jgi:hypothetical protein
MNRLLLRPIQHGRVSPTRLGDSLKWLRDTKPQRAVCRLTAIFPDASIDLVYLDPPFNSNANYNVLFKEAERLGKSRDDLVSFRDPQGGASGSERSQPNGAASQAQFHAFTDTWEWTADAQKRYFAN